MGNAHGQLEEKGMSLEFVFMNMFYSYLVSTIEENKKKLETTLSSQILREQWHSSKQWPADTGRCAAGRYQ